VQSTALRYFSEVVRCGSLRRAAEVLHIAPSAISRQIGHLEHRIKAPLFERHTNKLVLTEEGRVLARYAEAMEHDFHRAMVAIDDISHFRRGHVRIATVEAMVAHVLPKCIAAFQVEHPNLTATVNVMGTASIVDALMQDTADIGIAFCPEDRDEVAVRGDWPQPLHAVVSPASPLAGAREVSLADLSGFRVALPNESFGIRRLVEAALAKTPGELLRILETNSIEMVKGIVRHSNALTFLPLSAVLQDMSHGTLCAIPLRDVELASTSIQVLSMRGRTLSRASSAFLETFKTVTNASLA
jgi:DNA-binding transcriptional LysR family regulator